MILGIFTIIFVTTAAAVYPSEYDISSENDDNCHCVPIDKCHSPEDLELRNRYPCDDLSKIKCCYPNIITECGIRNVNEIIQFPWMVEISVQTDYDLYPRFLGGGSLLHPMVVLTAAHKVYNIVARNLIARAGVNETNRLDDNYPVQKRNVLRTIVHENFNKRTALNGIALLILNEPFVFNNNIGPICRNTPSTILDETKCFVTGYGVDAVTRQSGNNLKQISLPVVLNYRCQQMLRQTRLGRRYKLSENFICAGGEEGYDACFGDGGSPLVCKTPNKNNTFYQVGIVAWGVGCGKRNVPGVYVRTDKYNDWIEDKINEITGIPFIPQ